MRLLLATVLLMAGAGAQAKPLNYDYAYLKSGESHVNGRSFRNDAFGAYYEIGNNLHIFGSISDAGSYGHPELQNSRAMRLGLGGHWMIGSDTMFAIEGALLQGRYRWASGAKFMDTGWTTIAEFRHRFAKDWEVIAAATYTDVFGWQTREVAIGPVWHINDTFAVGAFYRHLDNSKSLDFTVRTYY
ncbi:MAG: hypothetical protein K8F35_14140 [Dokdonella sp.]|uniref:hypothetical protein n=1 Tax=Dokdonella sp. TaxID=2291710 RepID=UPI0025BFC390|nr:hypothetical protein [Dokdonella sp.]MBZ0224151.1 hypothetical protein [Dokdonella sp.]